MFIKTDGYQLRASYIIDEKEDNARFQALYKDATGEVKVNGKSQGWILNPFANIEMDMGTRLDCVLVGIETVYSIAPRILKRTDGSVDSKDDKKSICKWADYLDQRLESKPNGVKPPSAECQNIEDLILAARFSKEVTRCLPATFGVWIGSDGKKEMVFVPLNHSSIHTPLFPMVDAISGFMDGLSPGLLDRDLEYWNKKFKLWEAKKFEGSFGSRSTEYHLHFDL